MKKIRFAVLYPGVLALETKRVNKLLMYAKRFASKQIAYYFPYFPW